MKTKTIWNNIYSLLKEKPKRKMFTMFIILSFLLFLLVIKEVKFSKTERVEGVYLSGTVCTIKSTIPYEIAKKLKNDMQIIIDKKVVPLKIKEFGKIDYITDSMVIQSITIEVPKLSFYEKQTIEYQIIFEKEPIYKILIKAMKGGDA